MLLLSLKSRKRENYLVMTRKVVIFARKDIIKNKREHMKLSQLHPNVGQIEGVPSNPRTITEEDFEALKKSLRNFTKMLPIRPIIVDEDMNILGGNMRYKALCKLVEEKIATQDHTFTEEIPDEWVQMATDLTPEEKMEFIIKDNQERGQWDWDKLANEWEQSKLKEWDVPSAHWEVPEEEVAQENGEEKPELSEQGEDKNKRVIITYRAEQKGELESLLGIGELDRQRYNIKEIISIRKEREEVEND